MKKTLITHCALLVIIGSLVMTGCASGDNNMQPPPNTHEPTVVMPIDLTPSERSADTTLETAPFPMWLPMNDGTVKEVLASNYEIYSGDIALAHSFFFAYVQAMQKVEGTLALPVNLELLSVEIDDSTANDGYGRKWVLHFDEGLLEMNGNERELFLTALARTMVEGNPYRSSPPNFTGLRIFSGETEFPVDYTYQQ